MSVVNRARRYAIGVGFGLWMVALSASAGADTALTPFVGSTFGGGARDDFGKSSHLVYGATLTCLGRGPLGFEIDGQYSPHFFGGASESNVASLMGEVLVGGGDPGGLRFYAAAGAGLLKSKVRGQADFFDADRNSFGITVGGSVIVPLSGAVGLKGDLRYFRGLTNVKADTADEIDLTGFHFWRVSGGLAIHF
jgi:hypothetical protein